MPYVTVQLKNVFSMTIEDSHCTKEGASKGKYGLEVSNETLKTLKAFAANGYIDLVVAGEPTSAILEEAPVVETPKEVPVVEVLVEEPKVETEAEVAPEVIATQTVIEEAPVETKPRKPRK